MTAGSAPAAPLAADSPAAAPLALSALALSWAALTVLLVAATAAVLAAWVYQDARGRDSDHPAAWAAGVVAFIPLLAAYVYARGERTAPQTDRERATLAALLALLLAHIAGNVFSPPDVFAQGPTTLAALAVTAPLFYLIVYRTEPAGESGD